MPPKLTTKLTPKLTAGWKLNVLLPTVLFAVVDSLIVGQVLPLNTAALVGAGTSGLVALWLWLNWSARTRRAAANIPIEGATTLRPPPGSWSNPTRSQKFGDRWARSRSFQRRSSFNRRVFSRKD